MSRDYATVSPEFWVGQMGRAIRRMGSDAWVVAMYVMTSPHSSALGLFRLPLVYLVNDTGIPLEGASEALRRLSEGGFCRYDWDAEVLWVPEMAAEQIGETISPKDNRHKWLIKEVEKARKLPFFGDFLRRYTKPYDLPFERFSEAPPEGLQRPSAAPPEPLRSQEQDQDQDQKQEQEHSDARATPATPGRSAPAPLAALASRGQTVRGVVVAPELGLMPEPAPRPDDAPETRDLREVLELFEQAWSAQGRPRLGLTVNAEWTRATNVWRWACTTRPDAPHELVREAAECACASREFMSLGSPWAAFAKQPGRNLRGPAKTHPTLTPTTDAEWEAQLQRFQKRDAS